MKVDFDIVIVGAGPSGSTAAISASKTKYKTLILDRLSFPKDKICGDGIAFSTLSLLEKEGIATSKFVNEKQFSAEKKIRLLFEKEASLEFKNTFFFTLPRLVFDQILWDSIPNSIDKMTLTEVKNISKKNEFYELELLINGKNKIVTTKFIVAADGYSSKIKRKFFSQLNYSIRVASRYYIKSRIELTNSFDFYFLPKITPGYFWIFKVGEGQYNTGIYLKDYAKANTIFDLHKEMMLKLFNHSIDKNQFFTWPIPNNQNLNGLCKENIFLTGDAAGICDVFLGQGIDSGIISGQTAIHSIDYFHNENPKNYPLDEIYRYKLQVQIGDMLKNSATLYNTLIEKPEKNYEILKNNYHHIL